MPERSLYEKIYEGISTQCATVADTMDLQGDRDMRPPPLGRRYRPRARPIRRRTQAAKTGRAKPVANASAGNVVI